MNENEIKCTDNLTDNKELRERYISRVEVLDKVKKLMMIPGMELMTIRQVAEYYEVDYRIVQKCYQRNEKEFREDGVSVKKPKDWDKIANETQCLVSKVTHDNCKLIIHIDDNTQIIIPNRGTRCFSKRAVLRFGMLLRDSVIAQEVRTQLLNMAEHIAEENPEILTREIDKEGELLLDIAKAYASGDPIMLMKATSAHASYLKRHNDQLTKENEELGESNKKFAESNDILAGNILKWSNRASANKVVRLMAQMLGWTFGSCWKEVYNELLYRHNINLKSRHTKGGRKSASLLEYLHEDEWVDLYRTIAAMLQARYINPSEIFEKAKLSF